MKGQLHELQLQDLSQRRKDAKRDNGQSVLMQTQPPGWTSMTENELSKEIVDAAYIVHTTLGPGLLESVYESALEYELKDRGLEVTRQVPIAIRYRKLQIVDAFRADLIVGSSVIAELKSVEAVNDLHKKQLLTYLRLTGRRLGLLINFGSVLIKDGITRIVNKLPES